MTTEKMPDVIWAYNDGCTVEITCPPTEHDIFPDAKYLRAEPVEELLKQTLVAINGIKDLLDVDCPGHPDEDSIGWSGGGPLPTTFGHVRAVVKTVAAINKFLGENK